MNLLNIFTQTIKQHKLINHQDKILIGISGGADSICLFHLLNSISDEYKLHLGFAHVNYHLRGDESDNEALWIEKLAHNNDVPLYKISSQINPNESVQTKAREIRYQFFKKVVQDHQFDKVVLGHHLDDQIETFFLRMIRGTSLIGLSSMEYMSNNQNIEIIRPLLDCSKKQIIEYLNYINQSYCLDSSNLKTNYKRNYFRLEVLPQIEKEFPYYRDKITNLIQHIKDENRYFNNIIKDGLKTLIVFENRFEKRINLNSFRDLSLTIKKRTIVYLSKMLGDKWNYFSTNNLDLIIKHIDLYNGSGSQSIIKKKDIELVLEYEHLTFYKQTSDKLMTNKKIVLEYPYSFYLRNYLTTLDNWKLETNLNKLNKPFSTDFLKKGQISSDIIKLFLDQSKVNNNLYLRQFRDGDRIYINENVKSKKIKKILIDLKIPSKKRREILLLCDGEQIIGIISLPPFQYIRLSERYYLSENTDNYFEINILRI